MNKISVAVQPFIIPCARQNTLLIMRVRNRLTIFSQEIFKFKLSERYLIEYGQAISGLLICSNHVMSAICYPYGEHVVLHQEFLSRIDQNSNRSFHRWSISLHDRSKYTRLGQFHLPSKQYLFRTKDYKSEWYLNYQNKLWSKVLSGHILGRRLFISNGPFNGPIHNRMDRKLRSVTLFDSGSIPNLDFSIQNFKIFRSKLQNLKVKQKVLFWPQRFMIDYILLRFAGLKMDCLITWCHTVKS